MTEDRDSGEEPHPVRSKFIFVSQQRISEELLDRIKRAVQREEAEEAHRRVSRAADTNARRAAGTGGRDMRTFPIDQIPDEGLPRLSPRRLGRHGVLVTFADCAPYLTARPFQLDELLIVLVRLLTVPGGPLVDRDGIPLVPRLTRLPWSVADKPADALALADIGLWLEFDATAGPDDLDHMRDLVNLGVTHMLMTISWQPWWPHARDLLERVVWRNSGDTMLAGVPEGGEP